MTVAVEAGEKERKENKGTAGRRHGGEQGLGVGRCYLLLC